jgi:hypothetical protein
MPTGSSTRTPSAVFGNQFSVPRQQCFRCRDGRHLPQPLPPKPFGFRRQSPSLVVVELETPITHLFSKDAILLDQIRDNLFLMATAIHNTANDLAQKKQALPSQKARS